MFDNNPIEQTAPNLKPQWQELKEQNQKLLEHYNKIIKPTLLEFYELTQEDFKIYLNEQTYPEHNKPIITLTDGLYISYRKWDTDTNPTYSILLRPTYDTLTNKTIQSSHIDIQMVKLLVQYWDRILTYMDSRVSSICSSKV